MNTLLDPGMAETFIAMLIAIGAVICCAFASVLAIGAWTKYQTRKASK